MSGGNGHHGPVATPHRGDEDWTRRLATPPPGGVATPHRGDEDITTVIAVALYAALLPLTGAMRTPRSMPRLPRMVPCCYPSQGR